MKYLAVIFVLCVGVAVKAAPIAEFEVDEGDVGINVTFVPLNETTPGLQTIGTVSGQTISAATMPPASMTTGGSLIPVSLITIEPSSAATIGPIVTSTSPTNKPTPAPSTQGFDGASFGGGIALGAGLCIICVVVYVVYSRRNSKGYNTM